MANYNFQNLIKTTLWQHFMDSVMCSHPKTNGEIENVEIVNLFSFSFRNIVFDWCNNYMGDYPDCTFVEL